MSVREGYNYFVHKQQGHQVKCLQILTLMNITLALDAFGSLIPHVWLDFGLTSRLFDKSNSYFFFIGTAHSGQECLFEASQFLPSLLGGGWCGVGGGGGGHVGHRLDDLGHEVGMTSQLDLAIRVERRFLKNIVKVKPAIPHRRQ